MREKEGEVNFSCSSATCRDKREKLTICKHKAQNNAKGSHDNHDFGKNINESKNGPLFE